MAKLNLVIADLDARYAKGLSDYINCNHSTAFMVNCFTRPDALACYLKKQQQADVLLISPDFYDISLSNPNIKLKVLLSSGTLSRDYPDFQILNKYSTGEKLLGDIVYLYSKLNPFEQRLSPCVKDTTLIGVYSPAGGTGKTTIAAALSAACTSMGMQSFYLNLESIQSTGMLFASKGKRNLSYIFYYLKEKSRSLAFRMEGIKSTDTGYGVQYFKPPESPLEYEEIVQEELEQLLNAIREMGSCSYVFIDMSSSFDSKNYKIMDLCDHVVLVSLQEPISLHKRRIFQNELVKLSESDKDNISDKLIDVVNRYNGRSSEYHDPSGDGISASVYIPEYSSAFIDEEGRLVINDEDFRKAINRLVGEITGK